MERHRQPPHKRKGSPPPEQQEGTYPLPRDTLGLALSCANRCLNYGMRVERLLLCDAHTWELTRQAKERKGVRAFNHPDLKLIVNAHKARWEAMLDSYHQHGYKVKQFLMCADSRVIVGLSAESVLETSVRLHRVYGFPIIPGSALKGLARSYALWQLAERLGVHADDIAAWEKAERRTPFQKLEAYLDQPDEMSRGRLFEDLKKDEAIPSSATLHQLDFAAVEEMTNGLRAVFGTTTSRGKVIFFDAVPANPANLKLDLDVMNPYYGDYYMKKVSSSGKQIPPADYLNPSPVLFLAIGRQSEFLFAVASKDATLANHAQTWLQASLKQLGVGAKTVAGYGLWR